MIGDGLSRAKAQLCSLVLAATLAPATLSAAEHELDFSSRVRAVHVDEVDSHGKAASALFRINLTSEWTRHWFSTLEVDHVATAFDDSHSNGVRVNDRPLVPDVPGPEINRAFVRYTSFDTDIVLGRQRIEYDDQRFVGSVSFWQNEQTFDALRASRNLFTGSRLEYAYIAKAHRIFGRRARSRIAAGENSYAERPAGLLGRHRHNTHLIRAEFNEWDYSRLVGYGLFIDNRDMPQASNRTLGVKYQFNFQRGPMRYRADLEAAVQEQTEVEGEPRPTYAMAELVAGQNSLEAVLRYEYLGSSDGSGFIAPLGSGYRFQGFADRFINTPPQGVVDTSVGINWRARPWRIQSRYHHFTQASGNGRYGNEFNIDITFRPVREHSVSLRYADFRAASEYGTEFSDKRIVYLDYSYNF